MTDRLRRSHSPRHPRIQAAAVLTILSLAAITALAPTVLAGGTTTVVTAIPGGGWIQELRQHTRRKRAAGRRSWRWHIGQRQPPAHHGGNRGLRRRHTRSRDPILRPDRRSMAHIRDNERGNRCTFAAPDRLPGRGNLGLYDTHRGTGLQRWGHAGRLAGHGARRRDDRLANHRRRWLLQQLDVLHIRRVQAAVSQWEIHVPHGRDRHRRSGGDELHRRRVADHRRRWNGDDGDVRLRRCRGSNCRADCRSA